MGDRYDREQANRRRRFGGGVPPEPVLTWGLAEIGHNGGPPLDAPVNDLFVRWKWKKAHREVWKNPALGVLRFRVARAQAAGVSYHDYMLALLDTGRHLQAGDIEAED